MSKFITKVYIEADSAEVNIDDIYNALKPFINNGLIKMDISKEELPF